MKTLLGATALLLVTFGRAATANACTQNTYYRSYPAMFCYGANYDLNGDTTLESNGQVGAYGYLYCPVFNDSDLDLYSSSLAIENITIDGWMSSSGYTGQFCVEYAGGGSGYCGGSSSVPSGLPNVEHPSVPPGSVVSNASTYGGYGSYGTEGDAFYVLMNFTGSGNVVWSYDFTTTICE